MRDLYCKASCKIMWYERMQILKSMRMCQQGKMENQRCSRMCQHDSMAYHAACDE